MRHHLCTARWPNVASLPALFAVDEIGRRAPVFVYLPHEHGIPHRGQVIVQMVDIEAVDTEPAKFAQQFIALQVPCRIVQQLQPCSIQLFPVRYELHQVPIVESLKICKHKRYRGDAAPGEQAAVT